MPAQWTGEFIGKLHVNGISAKEFSDFAGISPEYTSAVLNGKREPRDAEQRLNVALDELLKQRNKAG